MSLQGSAEFPFIRGPIKGTSYYATLETTATSQRGAGLISQKRENVFEKQFTHENQFVIDLSGFPSGVYVVKVSGAGNEVRRKIVKL